MSRENVEIVRGLLAGLSVDAKDEDMVRAYLDRLAPDVEFVEDPRFPEAGTYRGRDELLRYMRDFGAEFEEFTFTLDDLLDAGGSDVVVCLHVRGRGKGSGAAFDVRAGWVYTLRDGRVVRIRAYFDRDEALQAVGLRE